MSFKKTRQDGRAKDAFYRNYVEMEDASLDSTTLMLTGMLGRDKSGMDMILILFSQRAMHLRHVSTPVF